MAQPLSAKLLKLTAAPIATAEVLAGLRGELADPDQIIRQLTAEADTVAKARQALGDLPPVADPAGGVSVLL